MTDETRYMEAGSNSSALSVAVVVTEDMVNEASEAGDLEQLRVWARQGVRVTTGGPLCRAIPDGSLELVNCLVQELGASVNQAMQRRSTPLIVAALCGQVDIARRLVELGADVEKNVPRGVEPQH
jgi:hypothetical protein